MKRNKAPDNSKDIAGNAVKEPARWKTADEPMTGAQRSYLNTLADEAGVEVDDSLTKAEAAEQIDQLRDKAVEQRDGDGDGDGDGDSSNTKKPPRDWKTGDEPMTGAQRSYLKTLCEETGEPFEENLTKAQASEVIENLRQRNPRTK
jgi:hypothetical protein